MHFFSFLPKEIFIFLSFFKQLFTGYADDRQTKFLNQCHRLFLLGGKNQNLSPPPWFKAINRHEIHKGQHSRPPSPVLKQTLKSDPSVTGSRRVSRVTQEKMPLPAGRLFPEVNKHRVYAEKARKKTKQNKARGKALEARRQRRLPHKRRPSRKRTQRRRRERRRLEMSWKSWLNTGSDTTVPVCDPHKLSESHADIFFFFISFIFAPCSRFVFRLFFPSAARRVSRRSLILSVLPLPPRYKYK